MWISTHNNGCRIRSHPTLKWKLYLLLSQACVNRDPLCFAYGVIWHTLSSQLTVCCLWPRRSLTTFPTPHCIDWTSDSSDENYTFKKGSNMQVYVNEMYLGKNYFFPCLSRAFNSEVCYQLCTCISVSTVTHFMHSVAWLSRHHAGIYLHMEPNLMIYAHC